MWYCMVAKFGQQKKKFFEKNGTRNDEMDFEC